MLGFLFSELIERSVGKVIKKLLIEFSEHSKKPLDERLYGFFDGWSAFLTAFVLMLVIVGVFKINPPLNPGPYILLTLISGAILFTSIGYGIIAKRI